MTRCPSNSPRMRLAILASGRGSHAANIIDRCAANELHAEVVLVASNNPGSGALGEAQRRGIATASISTQGDATTQDRNLCGLLSRYRPDWVITAGFLKKIGPETLSTFEDHILNIHPSLLPAYGGQGMYGLNVHRAVLDAGETQTGATVHWVNAHYDEGAIVAQVNLPIPDHITTPEALAGALLPHEHQLLINVLKNIASDHA